MYHTFHMTMQVYTGFSNSSNQIQARTISNPRATYTYLPKLLFQRYEVETVLSQVVPGSLSIESLVCMTWAHPYNVAI